MRYRWDWSVRRDDQGENGQMAVVQDGEHGQGVAPVSQQPQFDMNRRDELRADSAGVIVDEHAAGDRPPEPSSAEIYSR